jgi:hypothetical protein
MYFKKKETRVYLRNFTELKPRSLTTPSLKMRNGLPWTHKYLILFHISKIWSQTLTPSLKDSGTSNFRIDTVS